MVAILKSGEEKEKMKKLLKQLSDKKKNKGVDTKKYCGVIRLKEDAQIIQKKMRNKWD